MTMAAWGIGAERPEKNKKDIWLILAFVVICGYSGFMTKNPTTEIMKTCELATVEFLAAYDAYYANPSTDKLNAMRTAAAALETVIELAAANGIEVK